MKKRHMVYLCVLFCLLSTAASAADMTVAVSITPLKAFVQTIGADLVDVNVMVPAGASPATYEPKPSQMAALSTARLYFAIGVPFEAVWLDRFKAAAPDTVFVHTDKGTDKMPMVGHHEHSQQENEDHLDPHIWLSPAQAETIAQNIYHALAFADKAHEKEFRSGLAKMQKIIHDTDLAIQQVLEGVNADAPFMVYHPSWGYFARQYHLRQIPIEGEGKEPSPRELAYLTRQAEELGVKAILVQPQFSDRAAQAIARNTGLKVDVIDPMAEDWGENLIHSAKVIRSTLP